MSLHLRRTCRVFWCYQCQRSVRIISSPSFELAFCPRCFGQFLHELHLPQFLLHPPLPPPPPPPAVVPTPEPPADRRPPTIPVPVPGDYFAGPGLTDLIDQLTQNDRPGPPPAPASAIDAMPVVTISEAHLRDGSQCPVCKEEFEVGEEAREMPCKHAYHSDCIVPWLRMHNSCPVCRFQLPASGNGRTSNSGDGTEHARRIQSGAHIGGGDGGGGGGVSFRRVPTRWNPIPSLWPLRGSAPRREYNYHARQQQEEEDPLESPGGNNLIACQMFNLVFFSLVFFYILL